MPMVEEKSTQLIDIASIWLSIIIIWSESYVWPFEKVYKFLKKKIKIQHVDAAMMELLKGLLREQR